ncbi:MAG: Calx-beta domain-containing protein [Candidatus Saccharimonadales bacterium]
MPRRTKTTQSQVRHTPKPTVADVPSAPLVPGMKLPEAHKTALRRAAFHKGKARGTRHIAVVHSHSKRAVIAVSHGYRSMDSRVVRTAKRVLPASTRQQLSANRAANNGNLKLAVPLSQKSGKQLHVLIPAWIRHARHAVLPTTLIALLVFTIMPARAAPPDYAGTYQFGGSGDDSALAVAADNSGNSFVAGSFEGTVTFDNDFGGTPSDIKSASGSTGGGYITKIQSNGSYGWTHSFVGDDTDANVVVADVAADTSGNVYAVGTFRATDGESGPSVINFQADWSGTDNHTSGSASKAFVTKINSDGSYGWTRSYGDGDTNTVLAPIIDVDSSDNAYIGGNFSGGVVFDDSFTGSPTDTVVSNGGSDGFVTKINSDGSYGWTRHFGGTQTDSIESILVHATTVTIGGAFADTVDFAAGFAETDANSLSSENTDGFITTFDTGGTTYGWTKQLGGSGNARVTALARGGSNVLYVGGEFDSIATFGDAWSTSASRTARGVQDGFMLLLPSGGSDFDAAYQLGLTNETVSVGGIEVDGYDMIYVAGTFTGTVNFGQDFGNSNPVTSHGATSSYITSFSKTTGETPSYDWTRVYGAETEDSPAGSANLYALASQGEEVFAVGMFDNDINFSSSYSGSDIKSATGHDAFHTRLTAGSAHTIAIGSGLRVEDPQQTNLESPGTRISYPTIHVIDDDNDVLLVRGKADLTSDRDWSAVTGDSNLLEHTMVVDGVYDADGFDASTYELFVPRGATDTAVLICPEAQELEDVTPTCTDRHTYSINDFGVSKVTINSKDYWRLTNVADASVGGMSIDRPRVSIAQSDGNTEVTEGSASDSFTVRLEAAPYDEVVVTFAADPTGQIDDINPVVFSSGDWADPQTVYITALDDNTVEGTHNVDLSYSVTSNDALYSDLETINAVAVQITDNDTAGVTWTTTGVTTSEDDSPGGGATAEVCAALTARPGSSVVLHLTSSDTGEVVLEDSSITITPANWDSEENCAGVRGVADAIVDGPQQVDISISSITGDSHFSSLDTGELDAASVTNQDTSSANLIVTTPDGTTTSETGGEAQLCIALTASPATGSVTIPITAPGVVSLSDNSFVLTSANWEDGECITLTGQDDDIINHPATYHVTPGSVTAADTAWQGVSTAAIGAITFTNTDDDSAGFTLSKDELSASEGGSGDSFTLRLTSQPQTGKQVVINVTANAPSQVSVNGGNLVFTDADWDEPQTVTISAQDDSLLEGSHQSSITIAIDNATDDTDYTALSSQSATVSIIDNDTATISLAGTADATENAAGDPAQNGNFRVSISKTNNTGSDITVTYSIAGTAVNGTHYNTLGTTIAIPNGASYADIPISVVGRNNSLVEGNKTVALHLVSSSFGAATIDTANDDANITIFDDDTTMASLSSTQNGLEAGEQPMIFTVTLSSTNNTGAPISFDLISTGGTATDGTDYDSLAAGSIEIADGQSTGTVEVNVHDDSLLEATTESVDVLLTNPSNPQVNIDTNTDTTTATITDNDTATVALTAPTSTTVEGSGTPGQFAITLSKVNDTGSSITVNYTVGGTATANTDYAALSGSANIANGQNSAAVNVATAGYNNVLREADKTVILTYASTSLSGRISLSGGTATVTITDDETTGISGSVTGFTSESGTTATACFELASRPAAAVTLPVSSSDSSKVTVSSGNVIIAPGNWDHPASNCITLTGQDDSPPVITGTVSVSIITGNPASSDTFYDALGAGDVADLSVDHQDNDTANVQMSLVGGLDTTSEDGNKVVALRFTLTSQPSSNVTVPVTISDDSEGSFSDSESSVSETVIITPSNWNTAAANELTVYGADDSLTDGNITYTVSSGNATSADSDYSNLATDLAFELTNEDDDAAGVTINQSSGTTAVTEGGATDTFSVQLNSQPSGSNEAVITVSPANNQLDIGEGSGQPVQLTFTNADWNQAQTITVTATDDADLEGAHNASIALAVNADGSTEPSYQSYTGSIPPVSVAITDNETATASLTSTQNGNETGPVSSRFTVTLSQENRTGSPITFQLNPSGGTATATSDYANFSGTTVSIPHGSTNTNILIATIDDALLEGNETIEATLSSSNHGAVTIGTATATATITDNDTATVNVIASQPSASENPSSNGEFTLSLSKTNNTGGPITVNYNVSGTATSGADYTALSGSTTILHGQSSRTISVITSGHNDTAIEPVETVIITLTDTDHPLVSVGSPNSATVSIADDDGFSWDIEKTSDGSEEGSEPVVYTVRLSKVNATGGDVTATLETHGSSSATAGDDYEAFDGDTVTIPNGQQSIEIEVPVVDDNDLEGTETLGAVLVDPSEGTLGVSTATASITDNETATIAIEATDNEAAENPADNGTFEITLSKINRRATPIIITYTINGTATNGQDYATLSGTAMIASGQDGTTIIVNTTGKDDSTHEGDETVIITLVSTSMSAVSIGDPGNSTVTISDDDPKPHEAETIIPPASGNTTSKPVVKTPTTVITAPVPDQLAPVAEEPIIPAEQLPKDSDRDDILDAEEARAINHGDGNGDGIPDSMQKSVASRISPVTSRPITLEAEGDCSTITSFTTVSQTSLKKSDKRYRYPEGLVDFKLLCTDKAQKANVTIYYDKVLAGKSSWRKFLRAEGGNYSSVLSVQLTTQPIGKQTVSTAHYTITDGGILDDDGKADGMIKDPAGLAMQQWYIWDKLWILLPVGFAIWLALHLSHRRHKAQQHVRSLRSEVLHSRRNK